MLSNELIPCSLLLNLDLSFFSPHSSKCLISRKLIFQVT